MRKKSGGYHQPLQVDPINGDYYIIIPEAVVNQLSWYEDTEIEFEIESNELVLREKEEN